MISLLNLRRGEVVADIGAGTGYFTRRLAQTVGPAGRVLAEDVQPEMLTLLKDLTAQLGLTNITPVLGTVTDPRLPAASVDLALMVDVYHEFDLPYEMVEAICLALKPGGRLVYSTCSLEREENEDIVRAVAPDRVRAERLRVPGRHTGDGFYAAVLT